MADLPILFDAVVFDLDGTLVATDRFWVEAARVGARRAFAELGIERAMPTREEWMGLVGLPLAQGFDMLFADLAPEQRRLVRERCEEEETKALSAGQAAMIPGVAEMLTALRAHGLRIGVASNCGASYLETMMHRLGLARWVEEGRCLDTPGMRSKTAMVADLLETFRTRSAVMVGDRSGDRDAAWQNGLPHVHYSRGFAAAGETVECEARIDDMGELVPLLHRRARWIQGALEELGFAGAHPPRSLGVTGHTGSGKTLFATDVARLVAAAGGHSVVLALEEFQKPEVSAQDLTSTAFAPADKPLEHLRHAYDVEALVASVLEPHAVGKRVETKIGARRIVIESDDVLVFHGPFLLHPDLRARLERVVHLEASDAVCLRRLAARDAKASGPEGLLRVRRSALPAQRGFDQLVPPAEHADLVLDGDNALGPA